MNNRIWKALGLLVALALALGVGGLAGGSLVYVATRFVSPEIIVSAQESEVDPELGIVIAEVEHDSSAAEAGVVRGDVLQKIDGRPVDDMMEVSEIVNGLEPGDEIELTVLHGDDLRALTAILGDRDDRAYLGLVPCGGVRREVEMHLGAPGALIIEVVPDSPADEAGLQEGDVIVAVDGQELDVEDSLADFIAEYKPGDRVALEVERTGEASREVTVELGEHPDDEDKAYLGVKYVPVPRIGVFEGEILPFDEFRGFEFDELPFVFPPGEVRQGAVVQQVVEDSPASAAGLEEGDVITAIDGEAIESLQMLADAIAEREPGDEIALTVYQHGKEEPREVEVTLAEHPDERGKAYLGVVLGGFFMERFEGDEGPRGFRFFGPPFDFDFDFDFDLPFDELPFDREEWRRPFEFRWRWPYGEGEEGWPGWFGESI